MLICLQTEQPLRQAVVPAEHVEAAGAGLQVQGSAGDVRRLCPVAQRPGPPAGVPPVMKIEGERGLVPDKNRPEPNTVGSRPELACSLSICFNNSMSCQRPCVNCCCQFIAHGIFRKKKGHSSRVLALHE